MKKLISLFMAVVMLFGIGAEAFAAYEGDKVHAYESADCTIVYSITNEWSGNQQVSVSITNNSEETLRNWAIKFDNTGTISNIWNASVLENDGELCVIRNNGYNYEIISGATVEFGFMQQGENLSLPENISLCSKTADSTASAEICYEIQNNWGEGFIAAVTIKNITDEPLEAWKLSFNGNFEISSIWNANLLYTEDDSFKVENDITTTPIAVGETKTFSFEGAIASGEEPVMSDFTLTSIVIDVNADSDDSGETGESGESGETGESDESGETDETQEPTDPDEPVETEEPVILCFGEYLADENALEVYWYSTVEGAVSVYENTNDKGWVKLADITDEDYYKYEITEDFLVKYIKVEQETESGTIESEPFIVAYTEDGYVCTWLDTDEDGLPDYAEKIYGTDPENPDTDSDGLSDYDELYIIGTSPLKYDTDEDGTNDADSDLDSDSLTNAQELELGTSPSSADTDGDTLSDYAELYETNTDPLKFDTDGDTLSDSDDIALGLDPNDPETFGVPDAEYKVEQTISADSEVMERVNTDEAPYELSLEVTASGNVSANLIAGNSIYSTITESDARLGGAVSLSYYGGEVDKVKLIYEVGEDYISNDGSEYAANCVDLQGIKRYNIFRYFEDVNMLLPVATEFDVDNNTLYAETDELGTYCVLDMEVLLQNFGVAPDGTQTETVMAEYNSAAEASEASLLTVSDETSEATDSSDASNGAEKYYVTFVFDIRDGIINEGQLDNLKAEVREFSETVYAEGRDIVIRLMTQDSSDFDGESYALIGECDDIEKLDEAMNSIEVSEKQGVLGNYCVITDALGYVVEHSDSDNSNYVFTIYDQMNTMFEQNIADELMINAAESGVDVSVITPAFEELTGFQKYIADDSHGVVIDSFSDFADDVYTHIFDEDYEQKYLPPDPQSAFDAILLTGYERITLDSILYPNGENPTGVDTDTDNDTLTDWDEVDVKRWETAGLITVEDNGYINLPTLQQCMNYTELSYVEEGLNRFLGAYNVTNLLGDIRVLPISSDPTSEDGDGDQVLDIYDKNDLLPIDVFSACLNSNYGCELEGAEGHRFFSNETGENYICFNCGKEIISPELEDEDNLNEDDYILVRLLLSIYRYYLDKGAYASAEAIYCIIDNVRSQDYVDKYSYSFSSADGEYCSPITPAHITSENDLFITCSFANDNETNRKAELQKTVLLTSLKSVGDVFFLISPADEFQAALMFVGSLLWCCVSEGISAELENRTYDIASVILSCTLVCADTYMGGENYLSVGSLINSYCNKYGVYTYANNSQDIIDITDRDYHLSLHLKSSSGEEVFYINTKDMHMHLGIEFRVCDKNHDNENDSNFCEWAYDFDHTNGMISYKYDEYKYSKNQPFKNMMTIRGYDYALIGNYYYKRDILSDDLGWVKVDCVRG